MRGSQKEGKEGEKRRKEKERKKRKEEKKRRKKKEKKKRERKEGKEEGNRNQRHLGSKTGQKRTRSCATRGRFPPTPVILCLRST